MGNATNFYFHHFNSLERIRIYCFWFSSVSYLSLSLFETLFCLCSGSISSADHHEFGFQAGQQCCNQKDVVAIILAPSTFLTVGLSFSSIPIQPESATESTGAGHPFAQEELCHRDQYTWF